MLHAKMEIATNKLVISNIQKKIIEKKENHDVVLHISYS